MYINCKVQVGSPTAAVTIATLGGVNLKNELITVRYADNNDWSYAAINEVKPILRKLNSMTEDVMKEIYAFIFGRPFPDTGKILWLDNSSLTADPRWVMMTGVDRVGIEVSGTVWADCDLHHKKHNQHEVTRLLLKHRFDLFNLIDNGEAIDAATLPNNPYA